MPLNNQLTWVIYTSSSVAATSTSTNFEATTTFTGRWYVDARRKLVVNVGWQSYNRHIHSLSPGAWQP